ncbi:hypothetical protein [Tepidibacter hydrothermalis]|uniref:Uncharacterized protein n=1 Tax=Tepidibacter hydrothermalis TaxID=3036126 RepID=A0ABY8E846_9FIRM|nr:hypothetical protein [Tepidibacter hydrothermalis]WFD09037.1 hypothetical protein P4S50_11635 [Tepidibacter hydrothermalis]
MELVKYLSEFENFYNCENWDCEIDINGELKKLKEVVYEFLTKTQYPKGYIIGFKDWDNSNLKKDNLILILEDEVDILKQKRMEELEVEDKYKLLTIEELFTTLY